MLSGLLLSFGSNLCFLRPGRRSVDVGVYFVPVFVPVAVATSFNLSLTHSGPDDYKVANLDLADFGRTEIELAEVFFFTFFVFISFPAFSFLLVWNTTMGMMRF